MNLAERKIWGYRRENGRVGVRNYVAILPLDDISNAACEAVAAHIQGTIALPHAYGRLQFGEDLELHFRTMIGTNLFRPSAFGNDAFEYPHDTYGGKACVHFDGQ